MSTGKPRPIRRLAIVNRGEAAMRCIRAVKALRASEGSDLQAIALFTHVDRDAPFVRHADLAVPIPAETGAEVAAYLDHERLIDALKQARADAVWPGWGFVAEDPSFVERLEAEGIRFLGPSRGPGIEFCSRPGCRLRVQSPARHLDRSTAGLHHAAVRRHRHQLRQPQCRRQRLRGERQG